MDKAIDTSFSQQYVHYVRDVEKERNLVVKRRF